MEKLILGLDLGIASIGWGLLKINDGEFVNKETGEVFIKNGKIIDSGVRIFDAAEVAKTKAPSAEARRLNRTNRRRLFRKSTRCKSIRDLCIENNLVSRELIDSIFKNHEKKKSYKDVWILRKEALERELSGEELSRVLCHIVKHRGWKSIRKSEEEDKNSNSGKMKSAIATLEKKLKENEKTAGYYYGKRKAESENVDNEKIKNEHGSYYNSIGRKQNLDEITKIFTKQRQLCSSFNLNLSEDFEKKVYELCDWQKDIKSMKDMVEYCLFEPSEIRAPKESYSAELFNVYTKINNLKLLDNEKSDYNEKFDLIVKLFKDKKEVKYTDIRKSLKLEDSYTFKGLNYYEADFVEQKNKKGSRELEPLSKTANEKIEKYKKEGFESQKSEKSNKIYFKNETNEYKYKNPEESKIYSMEGYHKIKSILGDKFKIINDLFIIDNIMEALAFEKTDDKSREYMKNKGVPEEIIEDCLKISTKKFIHVSSKAIKRLLPHLKKGQTYDKACKECGYSFKDEKLLEQQQYLPTIEEYEQKSGESTLKNPVVKRTITQARKVINAIIRKYGTFDQVNIEFTRELGKSADERNEIEKGQKYFEELKKQLKQEIANELNLAENQVRDSQVLKYRLYKQQEGKSVYSLEDIDLSRMLKDDKYCEIDHILPYSKSFDDSMNNKVVVLARDNQNKKNRTPYEYLKEIRDWEEYKNIIWSMPNIPYRKKKNLTTEKPDFSKWKARNLCDTSYISKYLTKYLSKTLKFKENDLIKSKIQIRPGTLTNYLRHLWGLGKKDRNNDKHHMVDAIIIGCATQSMCQLISCLNATRNLENINEQQKEIDNQIEELKNESRLDKNKMEELIESKKWYNLVSGKFNLQMKCNGIWDGFVKEVQDRLDDLTRLNDDALPATKIISRMARKKVTGEAHKATIEGINREQGVTTSKTRLNKLTLKNIEYLKDKDGASKNLYLLIKKRLEDFNDDAEKAFKEPIYMCNKDGEINNKTPQIKTLKLESKYNDGGVELNNGSGIATNGGMPRVDIFCKEGKYYAIPIYVADFVKELPITSKPHNIDFPIQTNKNNPKDKFYNEFFRFSLFKDELILIEHEDGSKYLGYYTQYSSQTGQIYLETTDRSPSFIVANEGAKLKKISLNVIKNIKKFSTDPLGYITEIKQEKRNRIIK